MDRELSTLGIGCTYKSGLHKEKRNEVYKKFGLSLLVRKYHLNHRLKKASAGVNRCNHHAMTVRNGMKDPHEIYLNLTRIRLFFSIS